MIRKLILNNLKKKKIIQTQTKKKEIINDITCFSLCTVEPKNGIAFKGAGEAIVSIVYLLHLAESVITCMIQFVWKV